MGRVINLAFGSVDEAGSSLSPLIEHQTSHADRQTAGSARRCTSRRAWGAEPTRRRRFCVAISSKQQPGFSAGARSIRHCATRRVGLTRARPVRESPGRYLRPGGRSRVPSLRSTNGQRRQAPTTRAGSLVGANGQAQGKRRTRSVRVLCAYCGRSYLRWRRVAPATAVD